MSTTYCAFARRVLRGRSGCLLSGKGRGCNSSSFQQLRVCDFWTGEDRADCQVRSGWWAVLTSPSLGGPAYPLIFRVVRVDCRGDPFVVTVEPAGLVARGSSSSSGCRSCWDDDARPLQRPTLVFGPPDVPPEPLAEGGLIVWNAPRGLEVNGDPVRLAEAIATNARGEEVWGGEVLFAPTMFFPGRIPDDARTLTVLYYRGPGYQLAASQTVPLCVSDRDAALRTLPYAVVAAEPVETPATITTTIVNNSDVFPDDEVFLLLIGANADKQTEYLHLSQTSEGVYEMVPFDDTATTVLPRVNNAYVDRDGEPGSGSQKYSVRLSDMQPAIDKKTREPIPHAYTFQCPTTNLYHSIGFLSFGAPVRGAAIQANQYGAAIPFPDVPAQLSATLAEGSRDVVVDGDQTTAHLYAGLEVVLVSGDGQREHVDSILSVPLDGKGFLLSKVVPPGFGGSGRLLKFPNTVTSWKQYPITTSVTSTGRLGVNTNVNPDDPGRYFLENLQDDAGRHVAVFEPVASVGPLSGGGTFSGQVTGIPAGDLVFVSAFDESLDGQTGTFRFTVSPEDAKVNKLNLAQPSAVAPGADFGTPFEFLEFTITDTTVFADTSYVNAFTSGVTFSASYENDNALHEFVAGWPSTGARRDVLADLYALSDKDKAYQTWVYLDERGVPHAFRGGDGVEPVPKTLDEGERSIVRVLSASNAVPDSTALQSYFDETIANGWKHYETHPYQNAEGKNEVTINAMRFRLDLFTDGLLRGECVYAPGTNTGLGEVYAIPPPSSTDVVLQDTLTDPGPPYTNTWTNLGTDAHKALVQGATCAFNRGVFLTQWPDNAKFYKEDPVTNKYAQVLHAHALGGRVYALPYDDTFVPEDENPEFSALIPFVNSVRYTIEPFRFQESG